MRKITLLLAALSAVLAVSSCEKKEKEIPCPVTGLQIAPSFTIGYQMELSGNGFADNAILSVYGAAGQASLSDVKVQGTKVTAFVPLSVTPGTYTLVLDQDGGSWALADILLEAATCPFSDLALPSALKIGHNASVAGTGLKDSYEYSLQADGNKTVLSVSPTAEGISIGVPADLKAGDYSLVCTVGLVEWTMAESIEAAVYKRIASCNYVIDSKFRFDMDAALAGGLDEGTASFYEMYAEMFSEKASLYDFDFVYDKDGRLTEVSNKATSDGTPAPWYTISYNSATEIAAASGSEDLKNAVFTLDQEGKAVAVSCTYNKTYNYAWEYTGNCLTTVYDGSKEWCSMTYKDGNLSAVRSSSGQFPSLATYSADRLNVFNHIDIVKLLAMQYGDNCLDKDVHLANFLGISGAASANIPSSFSYYETPMALSCEVDKDGYPTSVSYKGSESESTMIPFCLESQSVSITLTWE